jgi:hypothetical protein
MRILGTIAVLLLTACGSSDDDNPGIACGEEQLKVTGTIDGLDVSLTRATTSYTFINKLGDAPGAMDASTEQGILSLEFNTSTANGQSSPARGSLVDAEGSLSVGNCATGEFSSTLTMDASGNGIHFTLRALHREPYCSAAAVTGELGGCMGFKKF